MGQKVHPTGIRLGVVKDHNSVWYADSKTYAKNLINDIEVREYILKKLDSASVSRVKIERPAQTARITIFTARPGIVIGKKGEDVDGLRKDLANEPVRLIEIMPGTVETGFATARRHGNEAEGEAFYRAYPAVLSPEDIAQTILSVLALPQHINVDSLVVRPTGDKG